MQSDRTPWFPVHIRPIRHGVYECVVQISRSVPGILWELEFDGIGFLVPCPMIVLRWRGLTECAAASIAMGRDQA